jgi:peptide-methionine (R)-S-oxide reductase
MISWDLIIELVNKGSPKPSRKVEKNLKEWKDILSPEQYFVTRQKGTEKPNREELCDIHKPGKYNCVCCDSPLFDSRIKYESGSGWPSFTEPITEDAVSYAADSSYGLRIETLCNVCGAHLGHVFPDGPKPSGVRFCINSVALLFSEDI